MYVSAQFHLYIAGRVKSCSGSDTSHPTAPSADE
jgi:hypothetical protein